MAEAELSPKFAPFFGMVDTELAYKFDMLLISIGRYCFRCKLHGFHSKHLDTHLLQMIFGCMSSEKELSLSLGSSYTGAGAAYGTAKSGIGIAGVGTFRPDLIMKVQRSEHCIYGQSADKMVLCSPSYQWSWLELSLSIRWLLRFSLLETLNRLQGRTTVYSSILQQRAQRFAHRTNTAISGFMHLAAGLSVGLTGLAAGYAIGVVGDVVRARHRMLSLAED